MTLSNLLRGAVLAGAMLLAVACSAHAAGGTAVATAARGADPAAAAPASSAAAPFTAGNQYVTLPLAAHQAPPTGPVELVEVFSYACPHCARFAPYMDKLRAQLPKGVEVRYMPAVFNLSWVPYAQAFYAARELGILAQTHDAFFKAMLGPYPPGSMHDIAAWYGHHGVSEQKFLTAAGSAQTIRQMAADQKTEIRWGIDATPTLVVGRRASVAKNAPFVALLRSAHVTSYAELQHVGLWMVKHPGAN